MKFISKWDTPSAKWFAGKDPAYLEMHLIPQDPALWAMDRFNDFIEARKKLILEKFKYLLVSVAPSLPTPAETVN